MSTCDDLLIDETVRYQWACNLPAGHLGNDLTDDPRDAVWHTDGLAEWRYVTRADTRERVKVTGWRGRPGPPPPPSPRLVDTGVEARPSRPGRRGDDMALCSATIGADRLPGSHTVGLTPEAVACCVKAFGHNDDRCGGTEGDWHTSMLGIEWRFVAGRPDDDGPGLEWRPWEAGMHAGHFAVTGGTTVGPATPAGPRPAADAEPTVRAPTDPVVYPAAVPQHRRQGMVMARLRAVVDRLDVATNETGSGPAVVQTMHALEAALHGPNDGLGDVDHDDALSLLAALLPYVEKAGDVTRDKES